MSQAAWIAKGKRLMETPFFKRVLQAKHLPLCFSVAVVTSILYHYGAAWTPLWLILAAILQWLLFRLFDFVDKHHVIGGAAFCAAGLLTLVVVSWLMYYGGQPGFMKGILTPADTDIMLSFGVWFFTPQSVIGTFYGGYTAALFLLFTFFIAAVSYYFSMIQYRVFMSFLVMCFPFTIYAKEGEVMPVPFIILLFAAYFALMIFCRQLHAGDPDVVRVYDQSQTHYLLTEPVREGGKKPVHRKAAPEIVDGNGIRVASLFLTGACILVLAIPKPSVSADRSYLEGLINLTAFTDYLMNAISGFSDSSDGGTYMPNQASRELFYATADEPVNLRLTTYTNYFYETDSWSASEVDRPSSRALRNQEMDSSLRDGLDDMTVRRPIESASRIANPYDLYQLVRHACQADAGFMERWGLQNLLTEELAPEPYLHCVNLETVGFNSSVYLSGTQTVALNSATLEPTNPIFQNETGILYRLSPTRLYNEHYSLWYLSEAFGRTQPMQTLIHSISDSDWLQFLLDLRTALPEDGPDVDFMYRVYGDYADALHYQAYTTDDIPQTVATLAEELTEGLPTDYDKAIAIRNYLAAGDYTYSLEFPITDADNVETFLFTNKTGVCYQFASAMTELCRAAGLMARYVEGYSLSEPYSNILNSNYNYVIRTTHAHAFTEVFVPGYGWMMFDATAPTSEMQRTHTEVDVLGTLQWTGIILLVLAAVVLYILVILVPYLQETGFRRWYRKHMEQMPARTVQKAFLRLRKQWGRASSATARELCAEMGDYLSCDMTALLQSFEQAVYGNGCTPAEAANVLNAYCTLQQAWKTVNRQRKKEQRRINRAARHAAKSAQTATPANAST